VNYKVLAGVSLLASVLLSGCAIEKGTPPVVDASSKLPGAAIGHQGRQQAPVRQPTRTTVQQRPSPDAVQTFPAQETAVFPAPDMGIDGSSTQAPYDGYDETAPYPSSGSTAPAPSGLPSANRGLSTDEQLDGPVLALLSSAREQQGTGNLPGAAASLERAQRIAPREPQVLYQLAEIRLAQGNAEQAEQIAQRALSYAGGRPPLQAGLWDLIARAREQRGDINGAAQARAKVRVNL